MANTGVSALRQRAAGLARVAALCFVWTATLTADVSLVRVISGVSSPTYVTHAGDGSNRLFLLEQRGVIGVMQPGGTSASVFLNISSRVLAGGERGLLGLAFHPLYESNGRFFIYYTRTPDGALIIAEYRVSSDPNVALSAETVLFTIPHASFPNHNGGMLAFGPGGYLFIGVGDGGSGNDPPNNAQNIDALLGKLLRVDVDRTDPGAGTAYSSPASNPFVGRAGRDEIFALGLRNPWRFSFDRATDQLWIGDVGQNAREEVDTPVVPGANFGWRVYEGNACTNNDPSLCRPGSYVAPLFDYSHGGGRCSITGGYVYRGPRNSLPPGTYVYADYCSGEILVWDGREQRVLLDTSLNITSFGEDEQGELYVVGAGGTIDRLTDPSQPIPPAGCVFGVAPMTDRFPYPGGAGMVRVMTAAGCEWTATSNDPWITIIGAASGTGSGVVSYKVEQFRGRGNLRTGSITVAGKTIAIRQTWPPLY